MNHMLNKLLLRVSLVFILAVTMTPVNAQNEANVWWFGTGAGINFNTSPPTPLAGLPINTYEGSSSICDPVTGALIFATDGQTVWYPNGTVVTGGTGLFGASSSTSSALVVPNPSNANQWFIFTSNVDPTNGTPRGHNYYVVNRAGSVITVGAVNPLLGPTVTTEQLVGLGDGAGGYWLVTHGVGNNRFYAFNVSAAGVVNSTPVISNVGTVIGAANYIGSMKANTCQTQIGLTNLGAKIAEVYTFNNSSGSVTGLLYSHNISPANPYGLEFSPKDGYLYYGTLEGTMYQMNLTTGTPSITGWTPPPNGTGKFGQLQLAPDGKIYVASEDVNSTTYVGTISSPDNPFATAAYSPTGFTLSTVNTTISQLGLPTFSRTFISSVLTTAPGNGSYCLNASIPLSYTFSGNVKLSTVIWTATGGGQTFTPGGTSSTSINPTVSFSTTGSKNVILNFNDTCNRPHTKTMTFTITAPKTPAGAITCTANGFTLDNPAVDPDEPNYIWYKTSVATSNIIGIGTPVTYIAGSNAAIPGDICLGVSSGTATSTSGSNKTIAPFNIPAGGGGVSPATSPTIDVLASQIVLKSFNISFRFAGDYTFTYEIKNGSGTTIYSNTITTGAVPATPTGPGYVVPVNTTLTIGTGYTINITTPGIQIYRGAWTGSTNAGEVTYNAVSPAGTNNFYTLVYDHSTFTATPVCSAPTCYPVTCVLPVSLLYFKGNSLDSKNILTWATASETNNDYFEIRRSTDGINFVTIGKVKGHGSSNSVYEYEFIDPTPSTGISYYQYIQYDFNGELSFSPIITIRSSVNNNSFSVSPNPSTSSFAINFTSLSEGEFTVIDLLGKSLFTKTIKVGTEKIEIGSELAKGAYVVRLSGTNGVSTQLIIKE